MKTRLIKISSPADSAELTEVAEILRAGGTVGIPTETVYGLAANALDGSAVKKIFAAKGRPQDNPLIVHISCFDEIKALVTEIPDKAVKLADAFWPGPLTIILPKSSIIPDEVSCGLPSVAVRMPSHTIANAIIRATGLPLAAPSANTSGKPSPTTAQHVMHDMDGKIDAVVDGGESAVGVESTVITLCTPVPRLLRPGGITLAQLRSVIGEVDADPAVFAELDEGERPASPGMKYKHYSPEADVIIIKGALDKFIAYVSEHSCVGSTVLCFDGEEKNFSGIVFTYGEPGDADEQAHRLFDVLRKIDASGMRRVYARCPETKGVGMAVYNRLLRAAAFKVVDLN